ncbi:hypothetical protein GGQ99_003996 [Aminobacter niigataensis]|uniref:Transposase n=1 Tax=Aminobacter niigataensis TaxID=83265 RepID=A0ABR6L607_9HYPH|nr:hypothetical protein [Aminobacter niigataensis]MBB4652220.1 hypothetical protein [Aminobacter niigataensis]
MISMKSGDDEILASAGKRACQQGPSNRNAIRFGWGMIEGVFRRIRVLFSEIKVGLK